MSEFQVGDRVRVVDYNAFPNCVPAGSLGRVVRLPDSNRRRVRVRIDGDPCGVESWSLLPSEIAPHEPDESKPRAYLAGPMSGLPEFNAPAFRDAAWMLRSEGWDVVSPVELDDEEGFDHEASDLTEEEYLGFLRRDLQRFLEMNVQTIIVLPGWEDSRGAALEVHVGRELGMEILAYPDLDPVKRPTNYRPPSAESVLEEALRLVHGDRGEQYGRPIEDFSRSAGVMSAVLGIEVKPEQVPLLMIAVKLSRLVETPDKRDSVVDIGGYAETYAMTMDDLGRPLR